MSFQPTDIDKRLSAIVDWTERARQLPMAAGAPITDAHLDPWAAGLSHIAYLLDLVQRLTKPAPPSRRQWISHGVDGIELHDREDQAIAAAYGELEVCRDLAASDGWPEETETIWYGVVEIRERVVEIERREWDPETDPGGPHDEWIDYKLRPVSPPSSPSHPAAAGTAPATLSGDATGSEGGSRRIPCPDCRGLDRRVAGCLTCGGEGYVGGPR